MREQDEVRRNSDGGPKRYWRANRSSDLCVGAKDQSNYLVAGLHRNFPQDSLDSIKIIKLNVKNLIAKYKFV